MSKKSSSHPARSILRDPRAVPIALVALALGLRWYGLGWGLPDLFEEATPMRRAWEMGRWGLPGGPDFNPHFFSYPGFTFYLHMGVQALLYLTLKLRGVVDTPLDYHVLYVLDKTSFVLTGRLVTTLFGAGTVAMTYLTGTRIGGRPVAIVAAVLLAINTFHISVSQMIEVDVPLTFFVTAALWLSLRLLDRPVNRNALACGLAVGLAAATKYTGVLAGLSVVTAALVGARHRGEGYLSAWRPIAVAAGTAMVVFFVTSPYVFLDFESFRSFFELERQHMRAGHFGGGDSTVAFYLGSLSGSFFGVPALVAALAGGAAALWRRREWAFVLAAFAIPYAIGISTWEMHAERYALPLLPVAALCAALAVAALGRAPQISGNWPRATATLLTLVLALPSLAAFPGHLERNQPDPRTQAARWIEANVSAGSFILTEAHGPGLNSAEELRRLHHAVAAAVARQIADQPRYAVQTLAMFQVKPERSALYYDVSLYPFADYIITTGAVRSRYENDPARFGRQDAFYRELDRGGSGFEVAVRFTRRGSGTITIYRNTRYDAPFALRDSVVAPRPLANFGREPENAAEARFYMWLAINYEDMGHLEGALAAYDFAVRYPIDSLADFRRISLGRARVLLALGRKDEAIRHLDAAIRSAPDEATRRDFENRRRNLIAAP